MIMDAKKSSTKYYYIEPRLNVAYFEYARLVHHLNINRLKNNYYYNYEILSVDEVFDSEKKVWINKAFLSVILKAPRTLRIERNYVNLRNKIRTSGLVNRSWNSGMPGEIMECDHPFPRPCPIYIFLIWLFLSFIYRIS